MKILWQDPKDVVEHIRSLTNGRDADVCIEAVGFEFYRNLGDKIKATINFEKGSIKVLEACMSSIIRRGIVSALCVYPVNYDNFPLGQFFDKGIILKGGQAPAHKHIAKLLEYVVQ